MRLDSDYTNLGAVSFPAGQNRQLGMHLFDSQSPKIPGFEDYEDMTSELCERANYSGVGYLTIDEKIMQPGWSQRRPRAHIDGMYKANGWGTPSWIHGETNTAIIVASDIPGCIAYRGIFSGIPDDDGDLEHIRDQLPEGELLGGGHGYLFTPDCVHESIRYSRITKRSFVRIALTGGEV